MPRDMNPLRNWSVEALRQQLQVNTRKLQKGKHELGPLSTHAVVIELRSRGLWPLPAEPTDG